jgi:hypothetical protein
MKSVIFFIGVIAFTFFCFSEVAAKKSVTQSVDTAFSNISVKKEAKPSVIKVVEETIAVPPNPYENYSIKLYQNEKKIGELFTYRAEGKTGFKHFPLLVNNRIKISLSSVPQRGELERFLKSNNLTVVSISAENEELTLEGSMCDASSIELKDFPSRLGLEKTIIFEQFANCLNNYSDALMEVDFIEYASPISALSKYEISDLSGDISWWKHEKRLNVTIPADDRERPVSSVKSADFEPNR